MGFLKGTGTYTRLRVLDRLEDGWRDRIQEGISRLRFVENMGQRSSEPVSGWVNVDDIGRAPACVNDWLWSNTAVLGIRCDSKRVNGKLLKVKVDEAIKQVMAQRGLERLAKAHRQEIAEGVEEDLLARALPGVKSMEFVWDVASGEVLLFGRDVDTAQHLFGATTGSRLYPFRMVDWLVGGWTWEQIEAACWAITGSPQPSLPLPEPERYIEDPLESMAADLAREFALWLWWTTEHGFGSFEFAGGPADIWIDDAMTFRAIDDNPENTFKGGAPSTTPEAKLSIISGKAIRKMRVGLRRGELDFGFTLATGADGFRLEAVKLPSVVGDDLEVMVFERSALLSQLHAMVSELFRQFIAVRADGWKATHEAINRWLEGSDEDDAHMVGGVA